MIDMKQFKDNVSNKIKSHQVPAEPPPKPIEEKKPAPVIEKEKKMSVETGSASIGASIRIKGDVTGDENLVIHGQVEGEVIVHGHSVTISESGKVKANINARQIIVEGSLEGDMNGDEKVVIRASGNVRGNIVAPRVTLDDGAMFKGSIEMEPRSQGVGKAPTPMQNLSGGSDSVKSA